MDRRHYPKDLDGGKNEWKALVKHYEEFDMKANVLENYAKNVVQSNIMKDLTDQKSQYEQRKKAERERLLIIIVGSLNTSVKFLLNRWRQMILKILVRRQQKK